MIATLVTLIVCAVLYGLARAWWHSHLNPVSFGILAWVPALVMVNWPPYFLSPLYIHLNRPISALVYYAMAVGFFSFWAGCALVKTLSQPDAFAIVPARAALHVEWRRLLIVFGIGLAVLIYAYLLSGLLDLSVLDEQQIAESRLRLHLGALSFVILLMDIAAIGFFALFLQSGRWLFCVPTLVALAAYVATLQKSPVVWLLSACLFVGVVHFRASYHIFWRSPARRLGIVAFGAAMFVAFIGMNQARGLAASQLTSASNPVVEQVYIYSGASAIMNVSVTLDGYLPSDDPTMGAFLARPVLWYFLDRDVFESTRYYEGVNAATYLISGWADFRWLGFFITPFLTGIIVMLYIRLGLSGSLFGLIAGAVATRALIFSTATDIIFDPTTMITLALALVASLFARRNQPEMGPDRQPAAARKAPALSRSTQ